MCAGPVLAAAAITIFKIKQKKIPTCLHGAKDGAAGGCGGVAVLVIEVTGSSSYENEINVSNVTKKIKENKKINPHVCMGTETMPLVAAVVQLPSLLKLPGVGAIKMKKKS